MTILKTVVLIGPAWPLRGGISLFNVRLFEALTQKGVDTHVLGFNRQYPALLFPGQSQAVPEFKPSVGKKMIDTCSPLSWMKTCRHIKLLQPDAVIFSWWHFWFWPCYKYMVHVLSNAGIPLFFLCHNYNTHDKSDAWIWFADNVFKKAAGLVFLSDFTLNQHLNNQFSNNQCSKKKQWTDNLPLNNQCSKKNPATISLFHPYYEWKIWPVQVLDRWSKKILLAGCMKSYKGLEIGLDLLNQDSNLTITITGDVYDTKLLRIIQGVKKKFKNRLKVYSGYCSDETLVQLMDEHDLLLCSHKRATQSGMAAFAFGRQRPVVATPVGGLSEQIHPKTGVVAEKATSESLLKAILKIYDKPPTYWTKGIEEQQVINSFADFAKQLCQFIEDVYE